MADTKELIASVARFEGLSEKEKAKATYDKYPDHVDFKLTTNVPDGWDILDVLKADVQESVYVKNSSGMNDYYPVFVSRPHFLVGRRRYDVYAEHTTKINVLEATLLKANNDMKALTSKAEALQQTADMWKANYESMTKNHETTRRLEQDMAKLRKALGEKTIREALETE